MKRWFVKLGKKGKTLIHILMVVLIFASFAIVGESGTDSMSANVGMVLLLVSMIIEFLFIKWSGRRAKDTLEKKDSRRQKKEEVSHEEVQDEEQFSEKDLAMVPEGYNKVPYLKLGNMIVKEPGIQMNEGEVCFYVGPAKGFQDKEKVVGYTGGGAGVSFRIMKGVSVHTGSSAKKAVRENVRDYSNGKLYLTNQRVLLLAPKYGFSVTLPKLAQVSYSNGSLCFYTQSGKGYSVLPDEYNKVMEVMQLMSDLKS